MNWKPLLREFMSFDRVFGLLRRTPGRTAVRKQVTIAVSLSHQACAALLYIFYKPHLSSSSAGVQLLGFEKASCCPLAYYSACWRHKGVQSAHPAVLCYSICWPVLHAETQTFGVRLLHALLTWYIFLMKSNIYFSSFKWSDIH